MCIQGGWARPGVCVSYSILSCFLWPHGCSPPGSSVRGILQVRISEWVAMPSSRGSSWPRDRAWVFCISRWILYHLRHQRGPQEPKGSVHSQGLGTQSQIHCRGGLESVQTWPRFWQPSLDSVFILFPLTTPHLNLNSLPDNVLPSFFCSCCKNSYSGRVCSVGIPHPYVPVSIPPAMQLLPGL